MRGHAIVYRDATRSDARSIVEVHLASFKRFFLSSLGPRFLRQFYEGLIDLPSGVLIVAIDGDRVVGFVGGATEQVGFYGDLLRTRVLQFAVAGSMAAVRHPTAVPRLVRARRLGDINGPVPTGPCLMSLAVLPETAGAGVGRGLVREFEEHLKRYGESTYRLTTDADDNERINRFYLSLGFRLSGVVTTPEGRRLNEYVREVNIPS